MSGLDQAAADFDRTLLRFLDHEYSSHSGPGATIGPTQAILDTATAGKLPEVGRQIAERRKRKVAKSGWCQKKAPSAWTQESLFNSGD